MNPPTNQDQASTRSSKGSATTKSKAVGLAIAVFLALYSFAAPQLNTRLGWNLPEVRLDSDSNINPQVAVGKEEDSDSDKLVSPSSQEHQDPTRGIANSKSNSDAKNPRKSAGLKNSDAVTTPDDSNPQSGQYAFLREISPDRYLSPAGLLYTPGSAEGHRLEHLRRHTQNDPQRPGSHGVFDGEMSDALSIIDQAYEQAKKGQRTTKKTDQDRTIYTVDMGKRVGYVGGREGDRRQNPLARRVRLVLEGNRVITAYPM